MAPQQHFAPAPTPVTGPQRMDSRPQGTFGPGPANAFPTMASLHDALPQQPPPRVPTPFPSTHRPPRPEYLIVGLFALRLTQHVLLHLDAYPGRDIALRWLESFLAPYAAHFALAKLRDPRTIDEYVRVYPGIVRCMIKQPKYRRVFMDMDPDRQVEGRDMDDGEFAVAW